MRLPLADGIFGLTPVQLALLGSGAALIYAIRRWRLNTIARRKGAAAPDAPSPSAGPPQNALNVREITMEIHALLADVEETARRITAQLDNRYTRLEQLMVEADEKIRRLEAIGTHPSAPDSAPSPFAVQNAPPKTTAPATAHALGHSQPPTSAVPAFTDSQRALSRLRHERGAPPAAQDPAYQPIYSLADSGKTPREIAQQLSRQPGEIELILALRQHT